MIRRSYTPHTEGDIPAIVMEFLSETDTEEYSIRPTYPYGKLWFYERIVQIPVYVTFDPSSGMLEVRQLKSGAYEIQAWFKRG
ncbi:MAG: Uma2 family endonuclease [Xenococcaceae cyanobacterium MO_188.B29]|nr:Uma2 family endonuclease [Xenococcaceae cyanobacterium MO_188.B29]